MTSEDVPKRPAPTIPGGPQRTEETQGSPDLGVPGVRRNAEHPRFREFLRAVGKLHPGATGMRGYDPVRQSKLTREIGCGLGPRGERLGPAVQLQPGNNMASHAASPSSARLKDGNR